MKDIKIYTTPICAFCARAKALLGRKGVSYEEIDVLMDERARAEMQKRSGGASSVPQIFIGDVHVGGYDELYALERKGELDSLLA